MPIWGIPVGEGALRVRTVFDEVAMKVIIVSRRVHVEAGPYQGKDKKSRSIAATCLDRTI